jgi:hypothetical protein
MHATYQPITLGELRTALAVDRTTTSLPEKKIPHIKNLQELWCPFLRLESPQVTGRDSMDSYVVFTHRSAREFLTQDPKNLKVNDEPLHQKFFDFFATSIEGFQEELGLACLTYLSYESYSNPDSVLEELETKEVNKTKHAFYKYSAIFWHKHLSEAGIKPGNNLFRAVSDFLRSSNFLTCIRVQSRYAPYLVSCLTADASGEIFRINSPTDIYLSAPGEAHYSDALPGWLESFGKTGEYLAHSYHLFIKEFGVVLLQRPGEINHLHPGLLGRHNFLCQQHWSTCNTVSILTREDSRVTGNPASQQKLLLAVEPTETGIIARTAVVTFPESQSPLLLDITDWELSLPRAERNLTVVSKPIRQAACEISDPMRSLLKKGPPIAEPRVGMFGTLAGKQFILSLGYQYESIYTASGLPFDNVRRQVLTMAPWESRYPDGNLDVQGIDAWTCIDKQHASRGTESAIVFHFQISREALGELPKQKGDDDTDSEDTDDENESDTEESEKPTRDITLGFSSMAIFVSEQSEEPRWFQFPAKGIFLRASPPIFHPKKPLILLALPGMLMAVNYCTASQSVITDRRSSPGKLPNDHSTAEISKGTKIAFHSSASI